MVASKVENVDKMSENQLPTEPHLGASPRDQGLVQRSFCLKHNSLRTEARVKAVWPSGLRRWLPSAVICRWTRWMQTLAWGETLGFFGVQLISAPHMQQLFVRWGHKHTHDACGIRTHAGRPHRLSRPTP